MADEDSTSPDKKRQEPPPIEFVKPGEEPPAPPPEQRPTAAWVTRPEDFQRPQFAPAPPRTTAQGPGTNARIAGALLILAAVISGASLLYNSLTPLSPADYANLTSDQSVYALNQVCGLIVIWAQAFMAIGGIMAFQRMNWRMSVGLSFVAIITMGGYSFLVLLAVIDFGLLASAVLGIIGFILVVVSRQDFLS